MLFIFALMGLLTLLLAVAILGAVIVGVTLLCFPKVRLLAPFVLFPVVLGAGGAILGSWGLAAVADRFGRMSALPFWAWPVGLLAGGAFGVGLGLIGAYFVSRALWKRERTEG